MTRRSTRGLFTALTLTATLSAPVAAQALALREVPPRTRPTALAQAYRLTLRSAWPQLGGGEGCRNGGDEVVEGTLARHPDGTYRGTFARRTLIYFCGAHAASGDRCELVLEGDGGVTMRGVVVPEESSPSGNALRLSWEPLPKHVATVHGACSAEFKRSVEAMYLSVRHGAEIILPTVGQGRSVERLENYAWIAEIE